MASYVTDNKIYKDCDGASYIVFSTHSLPFELDFNTECLLYLGANYVIGQYFNSIRLHPLEVASTFDCVSLYLVSGEIVVGNIVLKNGLFYEDN